MVDEVQDIDALDGMRGSVSPDAMWKILNAHIESFWEVLDASEKKDEIIDKLEEIDEEFCGSLCGEERDKMFAETNWNSMTTDFQQKFIDAFESFPELKAWLDSKNPKKDEKKWET